MTRSFVGNSGTGRGAESCPSRVVVPGGRDKRSDPHGVAAEGVSAAPAGRGWSRRLLSWTVVLVLLIAGTDRLAAQVAPNADWRTIQTEHFWVTFEANLEPTGRRVAGLAEQAWDRLTPFFEDVFEGRIELLVTDQVDISNGYARVAPLREIVIYARPPIDGFALSSSDDWLELVITHELVHVLHLDRAGPLGRLLRDLLGSVPSNWPMYPGFAVPTWVIEGLATRWETRITGDGRVAGSEFGMILRTAALAGRLETIDAASGSSPAWPAGQRPYVYGALFLEHMAVQYGEDHLIDFIDAVADQWIPWRLNSAARDAFGVSFSDAWAEWRDGLIAEAQEVAAASEPVPGTPITSGARYAVYPVARDGSIAWAESSGHDDPRIQVRRSDGSDWSTRTNGLAHFDLLPGGDLLVAQPEYQDLYRARTDLWVLSPDGGSRQLTQGQRLDQPSVSPDGTWAAAVLYEPATTRLVRVDLQDGSIRALTDADPAAPIGFPAVSPDGRYIVASVWRVGGTDLVVFDAQTGARFGVVLSDGARNLRPRWLESAALVYSSDRTGISQLYRLEIGATGSGSSSALRPAGDPVALTGIATGARFPTSTSAGRLLYSVYHADGWDLVEAPLEARLASARAGGIPSPQLATLGAARGEGLATTPASPSTEPVSDYSMWRTFRPQYWEPLITESVNTGGFEVVGPSIGAELQMADQVARHSAAAQLQVSTDGQVSGGVAWAWAGLGNPVIGVSANQGWDGQGPFNVQRADSSVARLVIRERDRRAALFAEFRRLRWWSFGSLRLEGGIQSESRSLLNLDRTASEEFKLKRPTARLADVTARVSRSTVRSAPISISAEQGLAFTLSARRRWDLNLPDSLTGVSGSDRSRDEFTGTLRHYRSFSGPGFADHVLALRVVGAETRGAGSADFDYNVGGTAGSAEPITGLDLFGESAFFNVRGFARGTRSGHRAWAASVEYRFPLALINRGVGLMPVHLDRIHGALFFDAGDAIRRTTPPGTATGMIHSVGAELRSEWLALFNVGVSLRLGVALPTSQSNGAVGYLRFGSIF